MSDTEALVYVVDDDASAREGMARLIRSAGLMTKTFASGEAFLATPRPKMPSCLVLDVNLPGVSGLELQQELTKSEVQVPIVFLTGHGDIPMTVRALKAGATDFLTKPVDDELLLNTIRQCVTRQQTSDSLIGVEDEFIDESIYVDEEVPSHTGFEQIIGTSPLLQRVLKMVETVAPSDSTVLMLGETGTGKELIARAIHQHSQRKNRALVKLNCAAIPTGLLESELFGHEKGAFTGAIAQKIGRLELADQGTLFLDEVGDIPIEIQPKLLRALQEREFERLGSIHTRKANVRLIAATNRDLDKMVADREFRTDLYYRLNVFPIRIPPLRERIQDIPLLASYFVQKFARQMHKNIEAIPAQVMKGLTAWKWPGNIRELENFIERAVILTTGKALEAPMGELRRSDHGESAQPIAPHDHEDIARIVKETINALHGSKSLTDEHAKRQREEIVRALMESKGRVGGADGAAARLAINRTTLLSRMKKLQIDPRQYT
jgi:DNA-binding NtrC family response regulator